jgi:GT2 family glycosyltransferase
MAKTHTPSQRGDPTLAVVIVTWRCAETIAKTLGAVAEQLGESDRLIVIDNASGDGTAAAAEAAAPRATVLSMPENLGFAAGCRAGAEAAEAAPLLLFLNPDAVPEPGALEALRRTAAERPDWGAWQAAVTLPDGSLNTGGGVVHYLGFAWAGRLGEPADALGAAPSEVGFASGAALTVRRELWEQLDGFDDAYFMYAEDVDLSLRLRLLGYEVGVVPAARVVHDYDFDKGQRKWFLLERNRWWALLATYPWPLLLALAPALLATELALLAVAAAGGWLPSKLRAQWAVLASLPRTLRRRRSVQASAAIGPREFADALVTELSNPHLGAAGRSRVVAFALRSYWRAVRAVLPRRSGTGRPSAN